MLQSRDEKLRQAATIPAIYESEHHLYQHNNDSRNSHSDAKLRRSAIKAISPDENVSTARKAWVIAHFGGLFRRLHAAVGFCCKVDE
jgi:hypothetical protein